MARKEPKTITRQVTQGKAIPSTVTQVNAANIELIGGLDSNTGVEEAEKVLVINPR